MRPTHRLVITTLLTLSLSACAAGFTQKADIETIPEDAIVFSSPSVNSLIIQHPEKMKKICLGRGADAIFEQSESGGLSISLVSIGNSEGDQVSETDNAGEEEMAGRSPAVLLARELFYRACELTNNVGLNGKDAVELFNNVLKVVKAGWEQESKNTTIKIGDTVTSTNSNSSAVQSSPAKLSAPDQTSPNSGGENETGSVTGPPVEGDEGPPVEGDEAPPTPEPGG